MPLKMYGCPGCSNFVEFRLETTYRPVCNVWGLFDPYQLEFLKKVLQNCRIKLAVCKLAYEIHQPNIFFTNATKYVSFASTLLY
jgi:hypothetical protein